MDLLLAVQCRDNERDGKASAFLSFRVLGSSTRSPAVQLDLELKDPRFWQCPICRTVTDWPIELAPDYNEHCTPPGIVAPGWIVQSIIDKGEAY